MCVVVKRKLQLFYWKKDRFLDLQGDITVSDVPRSIEWCEETFVAGFKGEYKLIKVNFYSLYADKIYFMCHK
jgi:Vam6/Vps39-like protein vacuolar protein sorting-associated protein 39